MGIVSDTLKLKLLKEAYFKLDMEPSAVLTSPQYYYIRTK